MAGVKGTASMIWQVIIAGMWLLVVLAIAFFVLYLIQNKQPIGFLQKGATILSNAAKGNEVSS